MAYQGKLPWMPSTWRRVRGCIFRVSLKFLLPIHTKKSLDYYLSERPTMTKTPGSPDWSLIGSRQAACIGRKVPSLTILRRYMPPRTLSRIPDGQRVMRKVSPKDIAEIFYSTYLGGFHLVRTQNFWDFWPPPPPGTHFTQPITLIVHKIWSFL